LQHHDPADIDRDARECVRDWYVQTPVHMWNHEQEHLAQLIAALARRVAAEERERAARSTQIAVDRARKEALANAQRARNWAHNSSDIEYMRTVVVALKTENYQLREELRGARIQPAAREERGNAPLAGALDHCEPAERADTSMEGRATDSPVSVREHEPQAEGAVPSVLEARQASAEGGEVEGQVLVRHVGYWVRYPNLAAAIRATPGGKGGQHEH
jgi:hypothetical protein